jgi:tRNA(Ile2) C34 agmatinyltransferase TiaS
VYTDWIEGVDMKYKYSRCPDCGRKGVYFKMGTNGEDHYKCRYCDFYFFTDGESKIDRENEGRWKSVQPNSFQNLVNNQK